MLHYNNSIEISKAIFFFVILLRNIFGYFYGYLWVGVLIFQFIAEKTYLNG